MDLNSLLDFASRHSFLAILLAVLTVALAWTEVSRLFRSFKALQPAALTALINRENALVVDLSSTSEFEKGHIPGSKNVQPSQFDPENKQLVAAKAMPVVAVCRTGQASANAAKRLKQAGFEQVYWLDGGILAWQQAGLPLVKGR